ncbi:unnamed protein product [Lampetra planeri]
MALLHSTAMSRPESAGELPLGEDAGPVAESAGSASAAEEGATRGRSPAAGRPRHESLTLATSRSPSPRVAHPRHESLTLATNGSATRADVNASATHHRDSHGRERATRPQSQWPRLLLLDQNRSPPARSLGHLSGSWAGGLRVLREDSGRLVGSQISTAGRRGAFFFLPDCVHNGDVGGLLEHGAAVQRCS